MPLRHQVIPTVSQLLSFPNSSFSKRKCKTGQRLDHLSAPSLTDACEWDMSVLGPFFLWHFPGLFADKLCEVQSNLTLPQALGPAPGRKCTICSFVHSFLYLLNSSLPTRERWLYKTVRLDSPLLCFFEHFRWVYVLLIFFLLHFSITIH